MKRLLDFLLALLALVVLAPLLAVIAGLVRLNLGSPVFFAQPRPGRHGRVFTHGRRGAVDRLRSRAAGEQPG
jgi:lipopolysaccharide/colanic/teichoic acid biosynthesis glycosyltransferase